MQRQLHITQRQFYRTKKIRGTVYQWITAYTEDSNYSRVYYDDLHSNTVGKSVHPTLLPQAMGKIVGETGFYSFEWQPV